MVDRLKGMNIQDLAFGNVLGVSQGEIEALSLHQQRMDMLHLYWDMKRDNKTLTLEEAKTLDKKFNEITFILENEYEKDYSGDYFTDFQSLVKKEFDTVSFIIAFESEIEMTKEELIEGFQNLIDSGKVWTLQGFYGRIATDLINAGLCHRKQLV